MDAQQVPMISLVDARQVDFVEELAAFRVVESGEAVLGAPTQVSTGSDVIRDGSQRTLQQPQALGDVLRGQADPAVADVCLFG